MRATTPAVLLIPSIVNWNAPASGREFFVDFAKGADDNPVTQAAPWKHASEDSAATGRPRSGLLQAT